jgi:hypothetical protein
MCYVAVFIRKLFLVTLPFVVIAVFQLYLPLDTFCFRCWEALKPYQGSDVSLFNLSGPFYPSVTLSKIEEGDLGRHTRFAQKKSVTWTTDSFGYRVHDHVTLPCEIVLIGDSNIVGSGLDRGETLAARLTDGLRKSVYPLAPSDFNTFLADARFVKIPPKLVICSSIEREIPKLQPLDHSSTLKSEMTGDSAVPLKQRIKIVCNLLLRKHFYTYLLARIEGRTTFRYEKNGMLFYQGDTANKPVLPETRQHAVNVVTSYYRYCLDRGIDFVFVPIPNKETVYWDYLPSAVEPHFLESFIHDLRQNRVPVIDTLNIYRRARQGDIQVYFSDDSHWNATGVELVKIAILKELESKSFSNPGK